MTGCVALQDKNVLFFFFFFKPFCTALHCVKYLALSEFYLSTMLLFWFWKLKKKKGQHFCLPASNHKHFLVDESKVLAKLLLLYPTKLIHFPIRF